jgi:hypothetical protein
MIVFGDHQLVETTSRALEALASGCDEYAAASNRRERAEAAMRLLIASGELAQGVLDGAFETRGYDDWGEVGEACAVLTVEAARAPLALARLRAAIERLARLALPESVTIRVPEGFAFYALDPALFARAARDFRASLSGPLVVVGVRSIGVSLAAVVAVGAEAKDFPVTIRPVGHPFRRVVRIGPTLGTRLLAYPAETHFAIVDEGPGLSGSSLGAVADWLEDHGIGPDRIHFFPGHAGDLGPEASPRHRARWRRATRHVVDFEEFRRGNFPGASWFEDDPAADRCRIEEIAGGKWRIEQYPSREDWPPAHLLQERRKYRYSFQGQTWLAKFVGLGRSGEAKLARARVLGRAGWVPPPRRLRNGFLVEEWLADAHPAPPSNPTEKVALLDAVAAYLAFRARTFPADEKAPGATPTQLFEMARVNTQERLGAEAANEIEHWRELLPAIAGRVRRVVTDNRMHAWEWLRRPDDRWLKADALDHAESHDLIGAQDLAWDVVGACVELDLDAEEREWLELRLARETAWRPDPLVLRFSHVCYLAFQMGYYAMAAPAHAFDPGEAARLRAAAERYAARLRWAIETTPRTGGGSL